MEIQIWEFDHHAFYVAHWFIELRLLFFWCKCDHFLGKIYLSTIIPIIIQKLKKFSYQWHPFHLLFYVPFLWFFDQRYLFYHFLSVFKHFLVLQTQMIHFPRTLPNIGKQMRQKLLKQVSWFKSLLSISFFFFFLILIKLL